MKTWQRALELCNDDNEDYALWSASILDQASIMNNMVCMCVFWSTGVTSWYPVSHLTSPLFVVNQAYLLIKFRQFDDATDLIDSSFELQQIIPEFANQAMNISTLSTMAFIYYQTKQHKASFDTYKACVQLQENTSQSNERDKADVLTKMAKNAKKMKDPEKTSSYLEMHPRLPTVLSTRGWWWDMGNKCCTGWVAARICWRWRRMYLNRCKTVHFHFHMHNQLTKVELI